MKDRFLKFTILLALVLALTATLTACGSKSKPTEAPAQQATTQATEAPATKAPTAIPTIAPTAVPTIAPTVAPTKTTQPAAAATQEAASLEEINASSAKIEAALAKLDSSQFDVTTKMTIKLKDGSEKVQTFNIRTILVNKPKHASQITFHAEGGGDVESMNGFEAIAVGDTAWIRTSADAAWMKMPASAIDQMTASIHAIGGEANNLAFAEKDLKKGTKKVGPLQCTVYEYAKKDILRLAKKYPKQIAEKDLLELKKLDTSKGTICITKDGLPLMFSMEITGSPENALGLSDESLQRSFGVKLADVKSASVSITEVVSNINKKFDIKPPKTGG